MKKWIARIGYMLIIVALFSVSPLVDYLPVDLSLLEVMQRLLDENKSTNHKFSKIESVEININYFFISTLVIGLVLVVIAKFGINNDHE